MAQLALNHPQVDALIREVSGVSVSKAVRMDAALNACCSSGARQHRADLW